MAPLLVGLVWLAAAFPPSASGAAFTSWQLAGTGKQCSAPPDCGDGSTATRGTLAFPQGVAVGPDGAVYVADYGDNEIRRIGIDGTISTVAGGGTFCSTAPACGDGGRATAAHLNFPEGVAVDQRTGDLYIADTLNNEVRKVSLRGTITRLAGTGDACTTPRSCGDGGRAASARLNAPAGVAVDRQGNVYIADTGDQAVRMVSSKGTITRVAGNGTTCSKAGTCGDGGAASSAQLYVPTSVTIDKAGGVYIADSGDNKIRKVSADGTIGTVAGNGSACASPPKCGDGANAKAAQLSFPDGVAIDPSGNLFIVAQGDSEIRQVTSSGSISTIGGTGSECAKPPSCGDGGAGTAASYDWPDGVATDSDGNVYVGDTFDNEVRWLSSPSRTPARIQTVLGNVPLLAFRVDVGKTSVVVHAAVGATAKLVLDVTGGGRTHAVVATVSGQSGFNALAWNRRFGSTSAPKGRYRLSLTGTINGHSASSQLTAQLP
jgi:trimeric autotransporter adhesin